MVDQLKSMKETLVATAQSQMGNLDCVDAKELGEVIDMVKDLEEAIYYCTITEAMKERKEEQESQDKIDSALMSERMRTSNYYTPVRYYDPRYERMYYNDGNGYYGGGRRGYDGDYWRSGRNEVPGNTDGRDNRRGYDGYDNGRNGYDSRRGYDNGASTVERATPSLVSDYREGRSHISRRGYMESKELHMDKETQMKDIEKYMQELSRDITEMIGDAGQEEKEMLRDKLNNLSQKIV